LKRIKAYSYNQVKPFSFSLGKSFKHSVNIPLNP
jgi:hypothetical protein